MAEGKRKKKLERRELGESRKKRKWKEIKRLEDKRKGNTSGKKKREESRGTEWKGERKRREEKERNGVWGSGSPRRPRFISKQLSVSRNWGYHIPTPQGSCREMSFSFAAWNAEADTGGRISWWSGVLAHRALTLSLGTFSCWLTLSWWLQGPVWSLTLALPLFS